MAQFKAVFGLKDGKSYQKEISGDDAKAFIGKKIGDVVKGEIIGLTGYEFQITGGSDTAGFPMRSDLPGPTLKKILAINGVGVTNKSKYLSKKKKGLRTMKGMRTRKTVAGNTIYEKTAQVNLKVVKEGKQSLAPPAAEAAPAAQ